MRLHLNNQYGNVVYKGVFGEHADLFLNELFDMP